MNSGEEVLIDKEDYSKVKEIYWYMDSRNKYVIGRRRGTLYLLHRYIMGLNKGDGLEVDHIDRNPLNNIKSNLRLVTRSINNFNKNVTNKNKSGVVGVRYIERKGRKPKWQARIKVNGREISKDFNSFEEAVKYRKYLEKEYFKKELLNG